MRIKKAVGMAVVLLMLGIGGCTSAANKAPVAEDVTAAEAAVSADTAAEDTVLATGAAGNAPITEENAIVDSEAPVSCP